MRAALHLGAVAAGSGERGILTPSVGAAPLLVDDFERADSTNLGGNWIERVGQWTITSGRARNAETGTKLLENNAAAVGKAFGQAVLRGAGSSYPNPGLFLRWSGTTEATQQGYLLQLVGTTVPQLVRISRVVNLTFTTVDSENATVPSDTDIPVQLYVADGVQEGYALGFSLSGTDTQDDGQNARGLAIRNGGVLGAPVTNVDDVLWFRDKMLRVSGLPAGYQAKVLDQVGNVVAEATEVAGTATVDLSRFGGCTQLVPVAGFDRLVVVDAGDVQRARYAGGVYPGLEAAYSVT